MTIPQIDLSTPNVPTADEILDGTISTFKETISPSLNLSRDKPISLTTPQGQIAQAIASAFGGAYTAVSYVINQFNPLYAVDRFQDALLWMYFLTRREATKSVATLICYGLDGTQITAGISKASDVYGRTYTAIQTVTIIGGIAQCDFACDTAGFIEVPANTVNKIYGTPIGGWESCNNPSAGVNGNDAESQRAAEYRRYQSVKFNGNSQLETIKARVMAVTDVTDCYADENYTGISSTRHGVSLLPHSIFICVVGGADADIANAIKNSKSSGCDMTGSTVIDLDAYNSIKFERANIVSVYVRVKVLQDSTLPSTTTDSIKELIEESANGANNQVKITIGETVVANRFLPYIKQNLPSVQITDLDISLDNLTWVDRVAINADSIATVSLSHITVLYYA